MRLVRQKAAAAGTILAATLLGVVGNGFNNGTMGGGPRAAWAAGTEVTWATSYADANAKAKAGGKLVMIDFYTDWCGWCKKLDKDTYTNARVAALTDKECVSVKVNAEKEGIALAKKYAVTGFPTILFLDPATGAVAGRIGGYMPPAPFAAQVGKIAADNRAFPALQAKYKANPADGVSAATLAKIYAGRGDIKAASAALTRALKTNAPNAAAACNAVGDYHQEKGMYNAAIGLFKQGAKRAKTGEDAGYAQMSIATCYLAQSDLKNARAAFKAAVNDPRVGATDKAQARQTIAQIDKQTAATAAKR